MIIGKEVKIFTIFTSRILGPCGQIVHVRAIMQKTLAWFGGNLGSKKTISRFWQKKTVPSCHMSWLMNFLGKHVTPVRLHAQYCSHSEQSDFWCAPEM